MLPKRNKIRIESLFSIYFPNAIYSHLFGLLVQRDLKTLNKIRLIIYLFLTKTIIHVKIDQLNR